MRFAGFAVLFLALAACVSAHSQTPPAPVRDAALAQRLGADERGMRQYILVILRTGPYVTQSDEERARLFEGHFANINRLAEQGKLLVAGPIDQNDHNYRGIFVFNVATIAEAQALVANDPTVTSGIFSPEYYEWYASAALVELPDIHRRIAPAASDH